MTGALVGAGAAVAGSGVFAPVAGTGVAVAGSGVFAPVAGTGVAASLDPAWALQGSTTERIAVRVAQLVGLAVLAAALAAAVALIHRWYTRERVPGGLPVLVGLSGVAVAIGATGVLRQVIGDVNGTIDEAGVLLNVVAMLTSAAAARAGTDVGDRLGSDLFVATGAKAVETEVSRVVQAVGRVITVELPEEVEDIVGYDPVPDETKEDLAGKTFVFPRRLTVAELRDRLVTRLKADYAVGHVDLELADDGTVEYLAVGSRAAGIGPTLPPETSAVAVRADPALAASAGDLVQVWTTDPHERVLTAEIRGKAGDVVTLAVDAADTRKLDDRTEYRLVTLPVETRPDREFASLLRAADETMAAVSVADGSPLAGQPVGALDVSVVAVRTYDGPVEPLPGRERLLAGGDTLYLIATPEAIRKVEGGARAATASPGAAMPPDNRVDAATPVAGSPEDAAGSTGVRDAPDESPADDRPAGNSVDGEQADERPDTLDDPGVPGIEALDDDAGGSNGEGPDEGERTAESSESESVEELTADDLADLPGTDPDDLTGTDVDATGEDDESGEGADGESEVAVDADVDDESGVDSEGDGDAASDVEDGETVADDAGDDGTDDGGSDGGDAEDETDGAGAGRDRE